MFARSQLSDVDSALGVLPVETVLADEHDLVHGDDVRRRLDALSPRFDAGQVLDAGGLAHALLDAWQLLSVRRRSLLEGIPSPPSDPPPADTPLDLVSMYVIGEPPEPISAELREALAGAYNSRQDSVGAPDAQARIAAADRALGVAIVDRFNVLLERRLADEPCFRPFIEAGCITALGDENPQTDELANRLLLEAAFPTQLVKMRDRRLDVLYAAVREHETAALCLSGGGIRSATFALGVIRGLARHGLLGKFDFLSTVSGGGYIGSWLSAWMHHAGAAEVQRELARASQEKLQPDPEPIRHLRAYSHYLSPRVGFLSGDTWTLAATLMRNLLLNWLVLVPLMAAVVVVPRFLLSLIGVSYGDLDWMGPLAKNILLSEVLVLGVILGTAAVAFVHRHRNGEEPAARSSGEVRPSQRAFIIDCLVPLVASAMMLAGVWYLWWRWSEEAPGLVRLFDVIASGDAGAAVAAVAPADRVASVFAAIATHWMASVTFILLALFMHTAGWVAAGRARARDLGEATALIATGAAAGAVTLIVAMWFVTRPPTDANQRMYITLAPPAYLAVILFGSQIFTGWTSRIRHSTDSEREWVARFNAWLLIVIVCWSAGSAIVLFGPQAVHAVWQRVSLAILGSGTGLITVLLGRSSATTAPAGAATAEASAIGGTVRRIALTLAAPVFALSIVIALAALNETVIGSVCGFPALAGAMRCSASAVNPTTPARSVPLEVLSASANARIGTLARKFGPTGADAHLHERLQALTRDASAPGGAPAGTGVALRAAIAAHEADVGAAVARSQRSDAAFVDHSGNYTRAVLSADSMTAAGGQTDSLLRGNFYDRVAIDHHATANIAARIRARDTLAADDAVMLRRLESIAGAEHADTSVTQALARLRDTLAGRARSAAESERQVRADSLSRALSRSVVDSQLSVAALANPSPTAMPIDVLALLSVLLGVAILMGWRIDTNKFSLHGMYYARLVRAYLGASRAACDRNPNPFTGFDANDDLALQELWPACAGEDEHGTARGRADTAPPLHVINMTLNLVAGANLAWQQRKAESFTATSLHAGSAFVGYRRTSDAGCRVPPEPGRLRLYGGSSGMTLGTAMTISGAAASPNAGENSSPLLTFLMTLFNARLGSWLGNPGRSGAKSFDQSAPTQKIRPIVEEMFGLTSDQSAWVYLSDGGHFENLGLYEMVLRRCRFIVVSDAGCDVKCTFDDLGNAVRKIRVDLGVPIDFPSPVQIFARHQAPTDAAAASYWAIGRIRYSAVDRGDDDAGTDDDYDGVLVYLKPAIYGGEPRDVYNYAQVSASFPHESTTDQFFSESQFESYRALGEYVVDQLVQRAAAGAAGAADVPIRGRRPGTLLTQWPTLGAAPPVKAGEGAPSVFMPPPLDAPIEPLH